VAMMTMTRRRPRATLPILSTTCMLDSIGVDPTFTVRPRWKKWVSRRVLVTFM
jgi:hypothetical protein